MDSRQSAKPWPYTLLVLLGFMTMVHCGCEPSHDAPPLQTAQAQKQAPPKQLFREPIDPILVETALEALPTWHEVAEKPTLVLLSSDPLLKKIPPELLGPATQLAQHGTRTDIEASGARSTPTPLVFEDMTLELALQAALFSNVVWILPLTQDLPLEAFRAQAIGSGSLSPDEAASFMASPGGCFAGTVNAVPMEVCSIDNLPRLHSPTVLHWEMSFFREIYKDEVRTPMYELLGDIAVKLRATNWRVNAVTINRSSLNRETTLATRFLADDLGQMIKTPGSLDAPQMPEKWHIRQQAFHADLLFKRDMSIDLTRQLVDQFPEDASAHFQLYHFLLRDGFTKAATSLDRAVALDPVYALEYLDLIDWARRQGRGGIVLELIDKARQAMPNDPFIKMQQADYLIRAGRGKEALPLVEELEKLNWSTRYFEHIPARLKQLEALATGSNPTEN